MKNLWLRGLNGLGRVPVLDEDKVLVTVFDRFTKQYQYIAYEQDSGTYIWAVNMPAGGYMTPVAGDSVFFVPTRFTQVAGLSKQTGECLWTHDFQSRIRTTPVYDRGDLYVPSGNAVHVLDEDGCVKRKRMIPGAFFFGAPVLRHGKLYVLANENEQNEQPTQVVYCLDQATLDVVWKSPAGKGLVITADASGLGYGLGAVYVGTFDGEVYALEETTGARRWVVQTGRLNHRSRPVYQDGRVYTTSTSGRLTSLDAANGDVIYSYDLNSEGIFSPVAVKGTALYVHAGVSLYTLFAKTGEIIGQRVVGHGPYTEPVVAGESLYLAAGDPPDWTYLCRMELQEDDELNVVQMGQQYIRFDQKEMDELTAMFGVEGISDEHIEEIFVDTRMIGGAEAVRPEREGKMYTLRLKLPKYLRYGQYALPVRALVEGKEHHAFLPINLAEQMPKIPKQHLITGFEMAPQTTASFSGGATVKAMAAYWEKDMDMDLLQEVVNYFGERQIEPHHKWRTGAVRIFHASSLPLKETRNQPLIPGVNLFPEDNVPS